MRFARGYAERVGYEQYAVVYVNPELEGCEVRLFWTRNDDHVDWAEEGDLVRAACEIWLFWLPMQSLVDAT